MSIPSMTLGPATVYFGDKNGKYPDGNQVVVQGADAKAVLDTPISANRLAGELQGADLLILGHAHEDHCAGMHLLPKAAVWAPEGDLEAVRSEDGLMVHYGYSPQATELMREKVRKEFFFHPRPDAQGYPDGRVWELGGGVSVRAVHMPGHTRGHSVLMIEPGGIAFIGDIDLTGFGPYYGDACSNLREFIDSLERIEHLEARTWITFHHKGVIQERSDFLTLLENFKQKIRVREQAMLEAISKGGMTLDELVEHRFMYPQGYYDVFVEDAERTCLREHLSILVEDGRAVLEGGVYRRASSA